MRLIKPLHHVLECIEAVSHCETIDTVHPLTIGPHYAVAVNVDVPGGYTDRFLDPLALWRPHAGEEIQFVSNLNRPLSLRSDRLCL